MNNPVSDRDGRRNDFHGDHHGQVSASLLAGAALAALSRAGLARHKIAAGRTRSQRRTRWSSSCAMWSGSWPRSRRQQAQNDTSAALADLKRSTSDQYVDLNKTVSALPRSSIDNGRLQITSSRWPLQRRAAHPDPVRLPAITCRSSGESAAGGLWQRFQQRLQFPPRLSEPAGPGVRRLVLQRQFRFRRQRRHRNARPYPVGLSGI